MTAPESAERPFDVSVQRDDDRVTLVLAGDLDIVSAPEMERVFRETEFEKPLVVDLREIDFIDSTGLRQLLSLRSAAQRNGQALTLVPPGPHADRIFTVSLTRDLFDWQTADD